MTAEEKAAELLTQIGESTFKDYGSPECEATIQSVAAMLAPLMVRLEEAAHPIITVRADEAGGVEHVPAQTPTCIHIVFDSPQGPGPVRGVEIENGNGKSINVGKWEKRDDGMWMLTIEVANLESERLQRSCAERDGLSAQLRVADADRVPLAMDLQVANERNDLLRKALHQEHDPCNAEGCWICELLVETPFAEAGATDSDDDSLHAQLAEAREALVKEADWLESEAEAETVGDLCRLVASRLRALAQPPTGERTAARVEEQAQGG